MKKLILVLVILLAVPAFGALNISLVKQSPDGNKVDLNYADACSTNLPRAFALKVEVNSPAKIAAVTNYKIGESNSTNQGYGIYPARIVIEANGTVNGWGTPVAEPNDPGSGTGLGTNKIVLEFGSLYVGDGNGPATSGTLCTLTMDKNGATGDTNIVATEEEQYRGGAVLEDGTAPDPNLIYTLRYITGAPPLLLPGPPTVPNPGDAATCVSVDAVLSWTGDANATSYDVNFGTTNPPAYVTNQAGVSYDPPGSMDANKIHYWKITSRNADGTASGPVWSFTTAPAAAGKATIVSPGNDTNNIARDANVIWTAGSADVNHRVFFGPNSLAQMVFKVEQAGTLFDPNTTGLLGQGIKFYWRIDEKNKNCGAITTGDVWSFRTQECYKSTDPNYYSTWILTGRPNCWCFKKQCRGDGNGAASLNKPVTNADLTNFKAGFNKHISLLRTTNVVDSAGVPGVCGDYNHTSSLGKPVTNADLIIYKAYFNKANTPGVVPDCNSTHINFWTN